MSTTANEPTGRELLAKRRRYRRLFVGLILAGVAVGLTLRTVGYPLVGEAAYWIGILAALVVWVGSSVQLFDERDAALERRAAHLTLYLAGFVLVVGASAARLLTWVTNFTVPTFVQGALYGYVVLFVGFGLSYSWIRYGP